MDRARIAMIGTCVLASLAGGCTLSRAAEALDWHKDWRQAQAAARASGRSVFVYVYQHYRPTCVEMENKTFANGEVIRALGARFELLAVPANSTHQREFLDRYHLGAQEIDEGEYEVGVTACPAYVLLDATGREYIRFFGYYPPPQFLEVIEQLTEIARLSAGLADNADDAAACAQLGHLHLALDRSETGKPWLERAVALDPDNRLGARQEAALDLAILAIPDDPDAAYARLVAYRLAKPQSPRALEVLYYMAVAQVAAERYRDAERILLDFQAIPPLLPDGKTPNPVYRSKWCEQADVLLKQLRQLSHSPATR